MLRSSRRRVLQAIGGLAAAASIPTRARGATGWQLASTPTTATLFDAAIAEPGAFAVGAGGVLLVRSAGSWAHRRSSGVAGRDRDLHAVAATEDGRRLWIAGVDGALAAYDPGSDRVLARPLDADSQFTDLACVGAAGSERVLVADDSGVIHRREPTGEWHRTTPGSGSTMTAVAFHCPHRAVATDTNGSVFGFDGDSWHRRGVEDADVNFLGVALPPSVDRSGTCRCRRTDGAAGGCADCSYCGRAVIVGGNGRVLERVDDGWRRSTVGSAALRAVAWADSAIAVGADGVVLEGPNGWERQSTPTDATLHGTVSGIAVGESGTVFERRA